MRWITLSLVSLVVCAQSLSAQTNIGSVYVGSSSSASYSVAFLNPGTLGAITATTGGKQNLDFSATGESCKIGSSYAANATCTVKVTFKPTLAGPRYGSVVLTNAAGIPLGELYVSGTGQAPQASFSPATQAPLLGNQTYFLPDGLATDSGGNAYYVIGFGNSGYGTENPSLGTVTKIPADVNADGTTADYPSNLSVDGGGNTYVTDHIGIGVSVLTPGGSYGFSPISSNSFGLSDADGNLYKSCAAGLCKESEGFGGSYTQSTISSITPSQLFVDGAGDVFASAASSDTVTIYKFTPSGSSYAESVVASGLSAVNALAADPLGNVYFIDGSHNVYKEALLANETYTKTLLFTGAVANYTVNWANASPQTSDPANRLAVDSAGNVYYWKQTGTVNQQSPVPNGPSTQVPVYGLFEAQYSQPSTLTFPATSQYSISPQQTVTITNSGDLPLQFSAISSLSGNYNNFTLPSASGCTASTTLEPGASCSISIAFTPVNPLASDTATLAGSLVITTNTGNAPGTQQTIHLTGTQIPLPLAAAPMISFPGYFGSTTEVAITTPSTAETIYYTTNGTTPTTASNRYNGPFSALVGSKIEAIATEPGYANSAVVSATVQPKGITATPSFSVTQGNISLGQKLTITDQTPGAQISYSIFPLDGSGEIDGSGAAPVTLTLTKSARIMAVAYAAGYEASSAVNVSYVVIAPTPVITFSGSGANETATLTSSYPLNNLYFYYTTNGTTATTSSTPYSGPFHVTSGTKVSAVSIAPEFLTSNAASAVAP